jgi:SAM-dependent methyltransferase
MICSRKHINRFGEADSSTDSIHRDETQSDSHSNYFQAHLPSAPGSRAKSPAPGFASAAQMFRRAVRAAIPEAVRARIRPYRKPEISQEQWEKEYRDGCWRRLQDARELAHYSVITGYYTYYRPGGSLLDVGCGEGVLQRRLRPLGYSRYLGIDRSQEAIRRAQTQREAHTEFRCADAETYSPQDRFDVIIFNELLYYLKDPVDVVRRLALALNPGGIVIISMLRGTSSRQIWRSLDRCMPIEDGVTVTHCSVGSWDVKVVRPPALSEASYH